MGKCLLGTSGFRVGGRAAAVYITKERETACRAITRIMALSWYFLCRLGRSSVLVNQAIDDLAGAENLCHQVIFMNHATGAVAPLDQEMVQVGRAIWQRAERRVWGAVTRVRSCSAGFSRGHQATLWYSLISPLTVVRRLIRAVMSMASPGSCIGG